MNHAPPVFFEVNYDHPAMEMAYALASQDWECWRPSGSAVAIAPRILLTALHNVKFFWEKGEERELPVLGAEARAFSVHARHIQPSSNTALIWNVQKVWYVDNADLAILLVDSPLPESKDADWKIFRLQLVPPEIGTKIHAVGFTASEITIPVGSEEVKWVDKPAIAVGVVTDVYDEMRDRGSIKFPSFATNARLDPGMSGGPVFTENGELVGLVCGGLGDGESGAAVSLVSSLWPIMGCKMSLRFDGDEIEREYTVRELAEKGVFQTENLDKIVVEKVGQGTKTVRMSDRPPNTKL